MNDNEFTNAINDLELNCTGEMLEKLERYLFLLKDYNVHTNLTRITATPDVYLKHFYDSLTIKKVIDLDNYKSLLDIGSGAGFPGLVLKIFYPHLKVTLLDSNNKKTKFLKYISDKLNLDVTIINDRAENFAKKNLNSFDVVTARAVANLRVLTEISVPFVKENGYFIAMKANTEVELEESKTTFDVLDLELEEVNNFSLMNDGGERTLLRIRKNKLSTIKDLRNYDKILKNPLVKK